jgi:hypothetical protein
MIRTLESKGWVISRRKHHLVWVRNVVINGDPMKQTMVTSKTPSDDRAIKQIIAIASKFDLKQ